MQDRSSQLAAADSGFQSSAPRPSIRSARAARVARMFGVESLLSKTHDVAPEIPGQVFSPRLLKRLVPRAGQIVLLAGPSGSGKSSLLRALHARVHRGDRTRWLDLANLQFPEAPVVNCLPGRLSIARSLEMLSRVGLGEVWTYLRLPSELSEGQRWRLKLAMAMSLALARPRSSATEHSKPQNHRAIIVADEFAALLDRITARIVARCLRRAIESFATKRSRSPAPCAIVATSHEDLIDALAPDRIVHCDFSRIQIERRFKHRRERNEPQIPQI